MRGEEKQNAKLGQVYGGGDNFTEILKEPRFPDEVEKKGKPVWTE